MTLLYIKKYTRTYIKAHPDWLFIFGDNLDRAGMGGQAAEARGEPNAIGIATKRSPHMGTTAFLGDQDYDEWFAAEKPTLARLMTASRSGRTIIWPLDGIGTGLANLERQSPSIWNDIEQLRLAIQ
jgi:hypothetical protein